MTARIQTIEWLNARVDELEAEVQSIRNDNVFLTRTGAIIGARADKAEAELARYKAAVPPADVAGLVKERRAEAECLRGEGFPITADEMDSLTDKLEAQARELVEVKRERDERLSSTELGQLTIEREQEHAEALRLEVAKRAALTAFIDETANIDKSRQAFVMMGSRAIVGLVTKAAALRDNLDPAARALLDDLQRGRELAEAARAWLPRCANCGAAATRWDDHDEVNGCDEHMPDGHTLDDADFIRRIAKLLDATETKEPPA